MPKSLKYWVGRPVPFYVGDEVQTAVISREIANRTYVDSVKHDSFKYSVQIIETGRTFPITRKEVEQRGSGLALKLNSGPIAQIH